jgi:hypothetical protein
VSETRRFCGDLCPEEHLPSPSKKLNWRRSNSALLAVSVTQIGRLITQNPDWSTKDADSWNLHREALRKADDLSDDVLAAVEGTF